MPSSSPHPYKICPQCQQKAVPTMQTCGRCGQSFPVNTPVVYPSPVSTPPQPPKAAAASSHACPTCGYMMTPFEAACPRCANLGKTQRGGTSAQASPQTPSSPPPVSPHVAVNGAPSSKRAMTGVGCAALLGVCWLIGVLLPDAGDHKIEAWLMAQDYVTKCLKSPRSAEFPSSRDARIIEESTNVFRVYSYVDAQNGFGALLREDWECKLEYVGRHNWHLEGLKLDGQMLVAEEKSRYEKEQDARIQPSVDADRSAKLAYYSRWSPGQMASPADGHDLFSKISPGMTYEQVRAIAGEYDGMQGLDRKQDLDYRRKDGTLWVQLENGRVTDFAIIEPAPTSSATNN